VRYNQENQLRKEVNQDLVVLVILIDMRWRNLKMRDGASHVRLNAALIRVTWVTQIKWRRSMH